MSLGRLAIQTYATILSGARRYANDRNTPYRYSDNDVMDAINHALIDAFNIRTSQDASQGIDYTDLVWTSGDTIELPAGVFTEQIIKFEDITASDYPQAIPYVPVNAIDNPRRAGYLFTGNNFRATLIGPDDPVADSDEPYRIKIRPEPTAALTVRIYFIAGPILGALSDTAKKMQISPRWYPFIEVRAALDLLSPHGEETAGLIKLDADRERSFREGGYGYIGRKSIPQVRRQV